MKSVFSLMLLVGLILAGVAVYIVQNYVGAYQNAYREAVMENQKARPEIETTQVYVANRDIRYGEELADEDFRLIAWPKDAIPEGIFDENNPIQKEGDDRRIALRAMNTIAHRPHDPDRARRYCDGKNTVPRCGFNTSTIFRGC